MALRLVIMSYYVTWNFSKVLSYEQYSTIRT